MANTAGIGNVAKQEALAAIVDGISLKAAIIKTSGTIGPATDAYSDVSTAESSGTGYSAGGVAVTNGVAAAHDDASFTTYWTPGGTAGEIIFGSVGSPLTLADAFNMLMIYNSVSSRNIVTISLGAQTGITAGVLTLTLPTNDQTTGLVRIANAA